MDTKRVVEETVIDRDARTGATLVYNHGRGWRASTWEAGRYTDVRSRAESEFEARAGRVSRLLGQLCDTAGYSAALAAARAMRPDVSDIVWHVIGQQPVSCLHIPTGLDLANRVEALRATTARAAGWA